MPSLAVNNSSYAGKGGFKGCKVGEVECQACNFQHRPVRLTCTAIALPAAPGGERDEHKHKMLEAEGRSIARETLFQKF